jgi:hypothetical protein
MTVDRARFDANRISRPVANTAATVTVNPAGPHAYILVQGVQASYNATPTGGLLTMTVNGVVVWEIYITAAGAAPIRFPETGIRTELAGHAVVVTLAAAGAGVTGRLNVQALSVAE